MSTVQRRYGDERFDDPVQTWSNDWRKNMTGVESILLLILNILSIPLQIYRHVMFAGLDFIAFDLLGLGPYLPITL